MAKKENIKPDVRWKNFWRQNDRFADLFNAVLFQGKEVLKPEDLEETDTDMSGIVQFKDYGESLVRARDVVKKTASGTEYAVYGVENQGRIHYAMPLRTLLYDGLGYLKEYEEIRHRHKKEKDAMTGDEFLSGMRRTDRLHPAVSVTVYYGEEEWDGPLSLRDMMAEMPQELEGVFSDYRMNLVQVRDSGQYRFHNEDVNTVFEISREIFHKNFDRIYERYKDREIDEELAGMIGMITDLQLVRPGEKREVRNMCTALEELKNECRQEGRQEGMLEGRKEGMLEGRKEGMLEGRSEGIRESVSKLLRKGFSVLEVADLLDLAEEEILKIQQKA